MPSCEIEHFIETHIRALCLILNQENMADDAVVEVSHERIVGRDMPRSRSMAGVISD